MGDVAKYRATTQENLTELLKQLIGVLVSRTRGRDLIVVVRELFRVLTLSRAELTVPPTLVQDLYGMWISSFTAFMVCIFPLRFVVLVDTNVPLRAYYQPPLSKLY